MSFFKNQKLPVRLGMGFGAVLFLILLVGFFALRQMTRLNDINEKLLRHPFTVSNTVLDIDATILRVHREMKDLVLAESPGERLAAWSKVKELDQKALDDFVVIEARFLGDKALWRDAEDAFLAWRPIREKVMALADAGQNKEAARITMQEGARHVASLQEKMGRLRDFAQGMARRLEKESGSLRRQAFFIMYLVIAAAFLAGILFTRLITRSVVLPAREIARVSEAISQGDLDSRIEYRSRDEIGQMAESLRRMIDGVVGKQLKLEEQLRQKQKMEAVGRLAGGVAHDLNNLLSPILGYSEMLKEDLPPDSTSRDFASEIEKAALSARDLIRQILAFARKQTLDVREVDLNRVIQDLEKLLDRTVREDIRIDRHLAPGLSRLTADPGQIEQVIMNLVVNAQDAMPEGGTLTLETHEVDLDENYASRHAEVKPGRYLLLAVSDTGTGMDKEVKRRVFEPFFSTKGREKGTGLGLATVYGIVRQHDGHIWIYSEPGHGTTFKIYMPVAKDALVEKARPVAAREPVDGTETVLVVEDDPTVLMLAANILKRHGYKVYTIAGGRDCLRQCEKLAEPPDILVTDVVMPEINGKRVFTELKARYPRLKVLYMSGYTDNVIAHRGVLDPGVDLLQKPFSVLELLAKMREVLDRKPS